MKKYLLPLLLLLGALTAHAQISISVPNDTVTGTTLNKLAKYNTTASATSVIITATTDTTGAIGVITAGAGTGNVGILTISGVAPCVFDNTTVANDYVQISSTVAGDCHDAGSTRPTSGQILGTVFGAGGSAGTYNVSLNKDIYPSAGAVPACAPIGSSDTLSAAGTFATTCAPTLTLNPTSVLDVEAHGVYTTTATASPQISLQVNAGGTAGICSNTSTVNPGLSKTTAPWELHCFIHIVTTGAPGTAYPWGSESLFNPNGGAQVGPIEWAPGTFSYTTNSAQTFSIQETGTMVAGQSITLQSFFVRQY